MNMITVSKTFESGVTNVYADNGDFLGYVHCHRGQWIATPDETVIQHRVESREDGVKFIRAFNK